jgi:4-hydroxy-2-oxoheptanedioate aldolase
MNWSGSSGHPAVVAARALDRPLVFGWVTDGGPFAIATLRRAGFQFVCVDCQHSCLTEADVATFLTHDDPSQPVFVRVSANDPALIGLVCDAGADGVVVPLVETADDAARAVAAVHYPPTGRRSFGPIRADLRPASTDELARRVDVLALIESPAGVEHVEQIAATPGLTGLFVGPADLSIGYGLDPRLGATTDQLRDQVQRVREACDTHGLLFGMHQPGGTVAARWFRRGVQLVGIGSDAGLLSAAAAAELAALTNELSQEVVQ